MHQTIIGLKTCSWPLLSQQGPSVNYFRLLLENQGFPIITRGHIWTDKITVEVEMVNPLIFFFFFFFFIHSFKYVGVSGKYFSYFSTKIYFVGTQLEAASWGTSNEYPQKLLDEVLLRNTTIYCLCFCCEIKKISTIFAENNTLSGALLICACFF